MADRRLLLLWTRTKTRMETIKIIFLMSLNFKINLQYINFPMYHITSYPKFIFFGLCETRLEKNVELNLYHWHFLDKLFSFRLNQFRTICMYNQPCFQLYWSRFEGHQNKVIKKRTLKNIFQILGTSKFLIRHWIKIFIIFQKFNSIWSANSLQGKWVTS